LEQVEDPKVHNRELPQDSPGDQTLDELDGVALKVSQAVDPLQPEKRKDYEVA
jgi:hypothetical protein